MDGGSMNLTVIRGTLYREPPFYEGVRGIEMSADVTRRRFTAVFLDAEGDEGGTSVMFETRWCRRYGLSCWSSSRRLCCWRVTGALSIR
jgi:hypothetical protein